MRMPEDCAGLDSPVVEKVSAVTVAETRGYRTLVNFERLPRFVAIPILRDVADSLLRLTHAGEAVREPTVLSSANCGNGVKPFLDQQQAQLLLIEIWTLVLEFAECLAAICECPFTLLQCQCYRVGKVLDKGSEGFLHGASFVLRMS